VQLLRKSVTSGWKPVFFLRPSRNTKPRLRPRHIGIELSKTKPPPASRSLMDVLCKPDQPVRLRIRDSESGLANVIDLIFHVHSSFG
jgi:hypothetical protein